MLHRPGQHQLYRRPLQPRAVFDTCKLTDMSFSTFSFSSSVSYSISSEGISSPAPNMLMSSAILVVKQRERYQQVAVSLFYGARILAAAGYLYLSRPSSAFLTGWALASSALPCIPVIQLAQHLLYSAAIALQLVYFFPAAVACCTVRLLWLTDAGAVALIFYYLHRCTVPCRPYLFSCMRLHEELPPLQC